MSQAKKLPEEIIKYLNQNSTFNMFGIINLRILRVNVETDLTNEELKELIQVHFGKEMIDGEIEFVGEK
jgi:hypothetical protein